MNIVLESISEIDIKNISFLETKKNIIVDGNFTKIIYSDTYVTMNGIFAKFPLKITDTDSTMNKSTLAFNPNIMHNYSMIKVLSDIEHKIIDYYNHEYGINKKSVYILLNQLMTGKIKLYREGRDREISIKEWNTSNIIIKISGVWETNDEVGITYKFLEMISI
jgi:hypothetical protein